MNTNCDCQINCTGISLIASIFIGIIATFLTYTAVIAVTPAFLWVLFGIAVGFLGITLFNSSACCTFENRCCQNLRPFLFGALGTVLTSVVLLGISFAATSIVGAIITGLLLFFFSFLLTTATCLIICRYDCN